MNNTAENFITELEKLGFTEFENHNLEGSTKQYRKVTESVKTFFTLRHNDFNGSIGHFSLSGNSYGVLNNLEATLPEGYTYKSAPSILWPLKVYLQ